MQKLNTRDPEGCSADAVARNVEQVKALFPEAFAEGNVDLDVLGQLLGVAGDEREEAYGLNWHGKRRARQLALTPSAGTLRPVRDGSVDWEATRNVVIEGDNLEVLKLLQKSYAGAVKLIYIDPPYNTGGDFVYRDDFRDSIRNYLSITGQTGDGGRKLSSNLESSGRFHTDWLNMMYPRLKLARGLLRGDGFICVSIGEEEIGNLRLLMGELFGEENFRNILLLRRYDKNLNRQFMARGMKTLNVGAEYVLVYARSDEACLNPVYRPASEERQRNGYWKGFWNAADRPTMRYSLLGVEPEAGQWKWKADVALEAVRNYEEYRRSHAHVTLEEYWEGTGRTQRFIRRRMAGKGKNLGVEHWIPPATGILRSSNWTDLIASGSLRSMGLAFDNPKSEEVIGTLVRMCTDPDDLIVDFFGGSGTTGHAVWEANRREGGGRRFILVQFPEPMEGGEFSHISELTAERLRRSAARIREMPGRAGDLGFRLCKLSTGNIRTWEPDPGDLERTLLDSVERIEPDRDESDLLFELLLKFGLDLCAPIETRTIAGKDVHAAGGGMLLACLALRIARDDAEPLALGIAGWHRALAPAGETTCVFRDDAFADDIVKTRLVALLGRHGLNHVLSL